MLRTYSLVFCSLARLLAGSRNAREMKWSKWSQNCENLCRSGAKNLCNGEEIGIDSTHLKRYNDSQVNSLPFFFSFCFFFFGLQLCLIAKKSAMFYSVFGRKQLRSWTESSSSSSSDIGFCFRKKSSGDLGSKAAAILDSVFEEWSDL